MDTFLPPKYSLNSFFVRHVAQPKRMKYISGLNNSQICAVNDVGFINYQRQSRLDSPPVFPPNNFNESLIKSSDKVSARRRERAIPPQGIWKTYGMSMNLNETFQQLVDSYYSYLLSKCVNNARSSSKSRRHEQVARRAEHVGVFGRPAHPQRRRRVQPTTRCRRLAGQAQPQADIVLVQHVRQTAADQLHEAVEQVGEQSRQTAGQELVQLGPTQRTGAQDPAHVSLQPWRVQWSARLGQEVHRRAS